MKDHLMIQKQTLHFPHGADAFHLEEARRHREILGKIEGLFAQWDYLPVETPLCDYAEPYRGVADRKLLNESYQFVGQEGEPLMIRSDVTLFLARQAALSLKESDLPMRLYYGAAILRREESGSVTANDHFQVGAELIGGTEEESDTEILLLLIRFFLTLKFQGFRLHCGSRSLVETLLPERDEMGFVLNLLQSRNAIDMEAFFVQKGYEKNIAKRIVSFLTFIGEPAAFRELLADLLPHLPDGNAVGETAEYLAGIIERVQRIAGRETILLDTSEVGGQGYHSGIAFKVYLPGLNSAAATGGRYAQLLGKFGLNGSSAGFSLFLRKLTPFIPIEAETTPPTNTSGKRDLAALFKEGI